MLLSITWPFQLEKQPHETQKMRQQQVPLELSSEPSPLEVSCECSYRFTIHAADHVLTPALDGDETSKPKFL